MRMKQTELDMDARNTYDWHVGSSPAATVEWAPLTLAFKVCIGLFAAMLVGLVISCFDDSQFYSDIFIEVSVIIAFVAGFFTNSRKLQFGYLMFCNLYDILFLGIFGVVFYHNFNKGIGILFLIQIIFLAVNLIPIIVHHLARQSFFFMFQRQLIYPTLFFTFVLLSRLPGGETMVEQVSHEIFSLIIFTQSFDLLDSIHKLGKAYHFAAYQNDGAAEDDESDEPAALEA